MGITEQYIITKFIESFIFVAYLFFIFISIQTFFLWKDLDKNTKVLIVTESFIQKNCLYALFLSLIVIFFGFFENKIQFDTYFGLFNMLAPASLVFFSFEWYSKLKPCVIKLLPIELTDFSSILKND
jgi:hypothetical protein